MSKKLTPEQKVFKQNELRKEIIKLQEEQIADLKEVVACQKKIIVIYETVYGPLPASTPELYIVK
jgi:hypothetical protein